MLPQAFFQKDALELAPSLLGCTLMHETDTGVTSGLIVETEAYSQEDAASHSYRGETERTKAMFGPGGHAYIYFTYGMHYCFNIVSGPKGHGQGVLIRALEPLHGIDIMKQRRSKEELRELCNGPAKLVQAMGISMEHYGAPLFEGNLRIEKGPKRDREIISGPRIGISREKEKPWRFWIKDSSFISK